MILPRAFKFRPSWLDADLVSQSTSAGDASRDQDRAAARGSNLVANDLFAQPRPEAALAPGDEEKLDAAALLSGRSQSQEAEFRIEHSFDRQDLFFDVLRIAYGSKKIAGLIMTLGAVFLLAGNTVASNSKMRHRFKSGDWTSDPAVCDVAIEAALTVLESFRPRGAMPWIGLGVDAANTFIKSMRHDPGNPATEQMHEVLPDNLRTRLQWTAERLERRKQSRPVERVNVIMKHSQENDESRPQAPFWPEVVEALRRRA